MWVLTHMLKTITLSIRPSKKDVPMFSTAGYPFRDPM